MILGYAKLKLKLSLLRQSQNPKLCVLLAFDALHYYYASFHMSGSVSARTQFIHSLWVTACI